jgi:myo-inositol-1(or 4)-monophosphatase
MKSALELVRLATTAARRAAGYLRSIERPRDPGAWTVKGRHDFVSDADRRSEELIREVLLAGEPGSIVMGEELSPEATAAGLVWIVDPIDGTTNFLHGFPAYAVSIAAAADGVVQAGVVLAVESDRVFHAHRDGGAWADGNRIRVSAIADPGYALIGTGFPFKHPDQLAAYQRQFARVMLATSGIRRAGSAALDLAWVAAGAFDGFWELRLAPWDVAAGLLLVREAGGIATGLDGRPAVPAHGPVVAGNPAIHRWLLDVLGE